ncbi:MAG: OmpH family outer membrane protein [Bacteroidales bacterium]|nr:OmpH family outer membrane protein [Bacteroidales bacterium]
MKKENLRKLFTIAFVLILTGMSTKTFAQKEAFIDSQYILNNIPEYNDAQETLNNLSAKWQKEIAEKHDQAQEMYKKFQAESILLPADVRKSRQAEIEKADQEVTALQKKYFGPDGELFKKRQELIGPIQEKVYNAIQTVATTENIDFVFDKASSPTLIYGNPKYDISDAVLDEVGKVMQTATPAQRR